VRNSALYVEDRIEHVDPVLSAVSSALVGPQLSARSWLQV
jgi:hypothetical protein